MHSDPRSPLKLSYSVRHLPGSPAEQKEKERIEEFQRCKKLREEQALLDKPAEDARRKAEYTQQSEAYRERMRKGKPARAAYIEPTR